MNQKDEQAQGSELSDGLGRALKVRFVEVGRQKKTWTVEMTEADLTEKRILREIRKSGALMSQNIEFVIQGDHGRIYAGMHSVGGIEIEAA